MDDTTVTVHLERIITLKEWTTIVADVEDLKGKRIVSYGNLGERGDEPDRIDVGFLPTDTDQSGEVQPFDLLRFRQIYGGIDPPAAGIDADYVDMDRSCPEDPCISAFDLLHYRQLINGVSPPATQEWSEKTMNNPRP